MWKDVKRRIWGWRGILIAAPSITGLVILIRMTGLLQILEWSALDQYFRLRPPEPRDNRIVIVGVSETDIQKYGFPLPDHVLASLLEKLKQQKPRAIGLDLYRNLPVGTGYGSLKKVLQSTSNLIGVEKVVSTNGVGMVAPQPILAKQGQIGANDLVLDGDGKLRRGILSLSDREQQEHLSFSFALSLLYLQPEGIQPEITENQHIKLGQIEFIPFQANDGGYIGADAQGYQILLNYRGEPGGFETVSVEQVLSNKIKTDFGRDQVVMIGATAESLNDFFDTPYSVRWMHLRHPMAGVEIHAQITSQILSSVLHDRPLIQTWAEWQENLWIAVWSLLGAWLVWQQRSTKRHRVQGYVIPMQTFRIVLSGLIATASLTAITFGAFCQSWWLPMVPALMAFSGSAIGVTAYLAQSAAEMRRTLGRYLTDEVVSNLLETPEGLKLKGEKRKVTILMADIRGFTTLSEQLPPEQVVALLNDYLTIMTKVIKKYGGNINDIAGDGILVFFGAPVQGSDDSHRAVACAIAMQLAMEIVNSQVKDFRLPKLEIGIGINTGEVVVGNIGSEEHAKYTAIGSHVNLAARIESFTVGGQILISQSTYEETQLILKIEGQTQTFMKGVSDAVTLYEVSGIGDSYNVFLPSEQDVFITLREPLSIEFAVLEGKHLSGEQFQGKLTKISAKGAEIVSEKIPNALSNLKLKILDQEETDAFYAKVIAKDIESKSEFYIRFTTLKPQHEELFKRLRGDRRARK
jgi:adenylate cyclase